MKNVKKYSGNINFAKLLKLAKFLAVTGGVQVLIQIIAIFSGFLIIRLLTLEEYAYYTIANSMLGTMVILSDAGISTGVLSQGGKVWQDRAELGTVVITGMNMRFRFAYASLILCVPILFYLLHAQGAKNWQIILILITLIPAFFATLSDSLLEVIPRLHQDIKSLQINQLFVGVLKLMANFLLFFTPYTFIALLANGLPRVYGNIKLKIIADKYADLGQKKDVTHQREILKITKKLLPLAIYFSFSNQITIWILSLNGNTLAVAQLGALGRFSILLSFFSVMFSNLIIPRFARISRKNTNHVYLYFIFIQLFLVLLCFVIVVFVWLFRKDLLWILGKQYANLTTELGLSLVAACFTLLESVSGNLLNSRGWVVNPLIIIGVNIGCILLSWFLFDLTKIMGVLEFSILLNSIFYIFLVIYGLYKIMQLKSSDMPLMHY